MSVTSFIAFSIFMLSSLVVLLGLGQWQVKRGAEKQEKIQLVNKRINAEPITLDVVEARFREGKDIDYLPVQMVGEFDHLKERYFFATFNKMKGWHVYTPFKLKSGRLVMVNRGFVSDAVQDPARRAAGQIAGETTIVGLVRRPGKKAILIRQTTWLAMFGIGVILPI